MHPPTERSPAACVASTDEIRAEFPALGRRHEGFPVAYFDGPGGTQVPRLVVDRMAEYLYHHNANTHWAFPASEETDALLAASRRTFAAFLNADPDEIVFGPNMTSLTLRVSRALGRQLSPGDAIVVTELDHHANVDPWRILERDRGVVIRRAKMVPETGQLDWDDLDRALSQHRTKLLAIGAASNALGTVNDVARAVAMAHEAGALAFVDAVHYAPHLLTDVRDCDCDFLACSAYKFHGPHVGVLYGKRERLRSLAFSRLEPAPDSIPERAESGTQNHEGIVGAAAAVEFLAGLCKDGAGDHGEASEHAAMRRRLAAVFGALHERGGDLVRRLWDGLEAIPAVRLYGPPPSACRTPTVSLVVAGVPSGEVAARLARRGVFASHGNFYAQTVVERLGQSRNGLLRLGCACYTTEEEVDRTIAGIGEIARGEGR
ncbi:Cysteine desulfurase [Aquisphaera giovannonii]|uniref:Cysteine desulfurase n=1 Tax=Aquisphaera giovannonii TaxID=406548 RepID=A0A5B9W3S7_9BACT|nr:cysteine desulfurase-like protein [Aquisphaera giovannonii]QEH34839.1 Cysteine desulfurase [Aquisphaera giovannonii]